MLFDQINKMERIFNKRKDGYEEYKKLELRRL